MLRELFYTRLLEGRIPAGQESPRAARLDIDLSGQAWTVSLVHIDGGSGELTALSVQQLLEEHLKSEGCFKVVFL